MKRLLLLSLILPLAAGMDLWRPVKNTGQCEASAATNPSAPTPIRITFIANLCGLTDGGTYLINRMWNTGGVASAATSHAENSTDTNNRVRVLKAVGGQPLQWDVYAADGTTAIAGNGVWSYGGFARLAELKTLVTGPKLYIDGDSGDIGTGLSGTGATGWANATRPEYVAVKALADAWIASASYQIKHADFRLQHAMECADVWYALGKPDPSVYLTCAKWSLLNDGLYPVFPCPNNDQTCKVSESEYMDYHNEIYADRWPALYTMMRSQLSAGERTTISNKLVADVPWSVGGVGYTATALNKRAWTATPATGTITCTVGLTRCTGASTLFTTESPAGAWLFIPTYANAFARFFQVASVTNNTTLDLTETYSNAAGASFPTQFQTVPDYDTGDYGWQFIRTHRYQSMICGLYPYSYGDGKDVCPGHAAGSSRYSGNGSGTKYFEMAWFNHAYEIMKGDLMLGLACAEDNMMCAVLAERAMAQFYDFFWPVIRSNWGGLSGSGQSYHTARASSIPQMLMSIKNSFADHADLGDDLFYNNFTGIGMGGVPKYAARFIGFAEPASEAGLEIYNLLPGAFVLAARPDLAVSANFRHYISNMWGTGYSSSSFNGGNSPEAWRMFLLNRPDVTAVAPTNTSIMATQTSIATCLLYYPTAHCGDVPRLGMLSWGTWARDTVMGFFDMSSHSRVDHQCQDPEVSLQLYYQGANYYGNDGSTYVRCPLDVNPIGGNGIFVVNGFSNMVASYPQKAAVSINRAYGSADVAESSANVANFFKVGAAVTGAHRTVANLKHAGTSTNGNYWFERVDVTTSSSKPVTWYQHFRLDVFTSGVGTTLCGSPSSSTCISVNTGTGVVTNTRTTGSFNGRLITQLFGGTLTDEGTYTGTSGFSHRTKYECTSNTSCSMFAVHVIGASSSLATPTVSKVTSGSHEVLEVDKHMWISAPGGTNNLTSAAATIAASDTQVVVDGLAAGTYAFKIGGVDVSGCGAKVVAVGEGTANCNGVGAGSLTVALTAVGPSPPVITTTSPLTSGTQNVAYSTTLAFTDGELPVTWSITSGTLPTGLSLNVDTGEISGTPIGSGTSSFTAKATDAIAGNASRAFDLTIAPEITQNIVFRGTIASATSALVYGGRVGLDANQGCTGTLNPADDYDQNTGGAAIRTFQYDGLQPSTTYTIMVLCGTDSGQTTFTTKASTTGPYSLALRLAAPSGLSITNVLIEWGALAASLDQSDTATCTAGLCPITISSAPEIPWVKISYRDVSNNVKATAEPRRYIAR